MSDYGTDELLDRLDEGRGFCGMCGEQAVERNSRGQYICMACLRESTASYDYVLKWDAHAEITRLRAALADAQSVGFAAGVEAAAKVAAMQAVYTREAIKRATGSELVSNLVTVTKSKTAHDIETAIRALTP